MFCYAFDCARAHPSQLQMEISISSKNAKIAKETYRLERRQNDILLRDES